MSPRVKSSGKWAKSGEYVGDYDADTGLGWQEFRWKDVPLGSIDTVDVAITPGWDDLGRLVILGIRMSKPITAHRLKSLPLDALRREASRLWAERGRVSDRAAQAWRDAGYPIPERTAAERLEHLAITDRSSDEFLAAVAATVREARTQGQSGWAAVSEATGVQRIQAQRYMAKARDAGHDLGTYRRTSDNIVSTTTATKRRKGRP